MEDISFPITLSEKKWYKSAPTSESILAKKVFSSTSFVSTDGQTVSSDVDISFPQLPKLQFPKLSSYKPPLHLIPSKNLNGIYDPSMDYLTISENNLNWSADGMLVVLMSGIPLIAEGKIEKKESGVPLLNSKQVYTIAEHEVQALTGILTIRMVSPNEMPSARDFAAILLRRTAR
jgi:hypothetical protein